MYTCYIHLKSHLAEQTYPSSLRTSKHHTVLARVSRGRTGTMADEHICYLPSFHRQLSDFAQNTSAHPIQTHLHSTNISTSSHCHLNMYSHDTRHKSSGLNHSHSKCNSCGAQRTRHKTSGHDFWNTTTPTLCDSFFLVKQN